MTRKGGRRCVETLAPATVRALEGYIADRRTGPVFLNRGGGRLTEPTVWRLIRRLARTAAIPAADRPSPHSLRHSAITAALNAGVLFRDVQDFAGHADPRTTRRYDRSRHSSTACHLRARQPVGLQRGRQADSRDRGHIPIRTPG